MRRESANPPASWFLAATFGVALAFRLVGLGGSSMWLDEIMETLMARGTLRQLFASLLYDRVHPPLEPLLSWLLLELGWGELARRLLYAIVGAAAVALFARWLARRFDLATVALAALLLSCSPLLIRFSHELRPYALALLLSVWALDAADRWLALGARRIPVELATAAALAAMTHYFAVVVWAPILAAWFEARRSGAVPSQRAGRDVAAVALSMLPLVVWLVVQARFGGPPGYFPRLDWSWNEVANRFGYLVMRGYGGQPRNFAGLLLFAGLAAGGLALLVRRRGGLTMLAGLFAGTALIEITLWQAQRFSHPRYNLFGLLFLLPTIAVAVVAGARGLARWSRRAGVASGGLITACLVAASWSGVAGYARHGRPDWPAVALAVRAIGGENARVVASNQWTQISLGYYLGRYTTWPQEPAGLVQVMNDRDRLGAELAREPGCTLVVVAGYPEAARLVDGFRPMRPLLFLPETDQARLYRFAAPGTARSDCFPPAGLELEHEAGYGDLLPWLGLTPP